MNRRQFLINAGYSSMALLGAGVLPYAMHSKADPSQTLAADPDFEPDLDISLISRPDGVGIFPVIATRVWRYQVRITKGDESRVNEIPQSYLGPIIRVRQGERVRIRYTNDIPQESIIHWHGLHVPAIMDGHPRNVVSSGKSYLYEFKVTNRAGTYWYHPHPHGKTGPRVYGGMAGPFFGFR